MKIKSLAIAAFLLCLVSLSSAAVQASETAGSFARAELIRAIGVATVADLNFGNVAPGSTPGSVEMSPFGDRVASGGVFLGNAAGAQGARFDVLGEDNAAFSVSFPVSINVSDGGSNTMLVDDFTSVGGSINPIGSGAFIVGATLHVDGNQPSGSYSGTFDVTVAYN